MDALAELAGFMAAHAVWSVCDGETLVPMLATESADGTRDLQRLATDRLEDGAAMGQQMLADNPDGAAFAVLVVDGFLTLEKQKYDALLVTAVAYGEPAGRFVMGIPYRPARDKRGFAVHRPKLLEFDAPGASDPSSLTEAFFRGADSHEKASAVWERHHDDSV